MIRFLNNHIHYFLNAWVFFTRFPGPVNAFYTTQYQKKAILYFPVIGLLTGGLAAILLSVLMYIFTLEIAVVMGLIFCVIITGGLHEDGFADFCDGFGASGQKDKILTIMKDSGTGAYAVMGLTGIHFLKVFALSDSDPFYLPFIIIAGHSTSRFMAMLPVFYLDYVSAYKTKAHAYVYKMPWYYLIMPLLTALLPFLYLDLQHLLILPVLLLLTIFMNQYFYSKIGGYTGDCLGALQQINETVFYLFTGSVLWNYF